MKDGDINYNYCLVAFVDVLGQKEAFKENGKYLDLIYNPTNDAEILTRKLVGAHKKTIVAIDHLRRFFNSYFSAFLEERPLLVKIPEKVVGEFLEMRKVSHIDIKGFSDSILISCPFNSTKYFSNVMNGVHAALMACGAMFIFALSTKMPIRIGVDVGFVSKLENGEVYGPALFRAYELESIHAGYPRILLGRTLIDFLANLSLEYPQIKDQTNYDLKWCKGLADECLKVILKESDEIYVLNYLDESFLNSFRQDVVNLDQMIIDSEKFIEDQCVAFKNDEKLSQRYQLMRKFFDDNKKRK